MMIMHAFKTDYIDDLMQETLHKCMEGSTVQPPPNLPQPLSSAYEKPDKISAIKTHRSRFTSLH